MRPYEVAPAMQLSAATVVHRHDDAVLKPKELLVGIGAPAGLLQFPNSGGFALVLNHKAAGANDGSSARFVVRQSDDTIAQWRDAMGLAQDTSSPFSNVIIVTEDASLDTCLALVALHRRLLGKTTPGQWVQYVADWEAGKVLAAGPPTQSAGSLHSALVHARFDRDAGVLRIGEALQEGVAYLSALIDAGVDPALVPENLPIALHALASSRLATEKQRYRRLRESFPQLQLAVPIVGANRRRIVDVALVTETTPTGALKAFLRSDPDSFTGDGFGMFALHRPSVTGIGPDAVLHEEISVSVDPQSGLNLEQLWGYLEKREEEAWTNSGSIRPRDNPRNLQSFAKPGAKVSADIKPSNEPWWDDNGRYTLIAGPRPVAPGVPGSKLSWHDFLAALWRLYAPGREIKVRRRLSKSNEDLALMSDTPLALRDPESIGSDRVFIDLMKSPGDEQEPITWTPTLSRSLAAFTFNGPISIDRLPDDDDFDILHARGGVVVVTPTGIVLFEHTPRLGFPAEALRKAATEAANQLASAVRLESRLEGAEAAVEAAIGKGSSRTRQEALAQIYRIMLEALPEPRAKHVAEPDPFVRNVREKIERRWGSAARFRHVADTAQALETMVVSSSNVRKDTLLTRVAIYGLPAAVFGNVLGVAFNNVGLPTGVFGVSWSAVAWYLGLTIATTILLKIIDLLIQRNWERSIRKSRVER